MKKFGLFFVILMVMMAVGCSNSSNGHDDGDAISTGRDTGNGSGTGNAGNGNANNNSNSGSGNRVTGVNYGNDNWPSTLNGKILVCEHYEVELTYFESYYLNAGLATATGMIKRQVWEYNNYEYIVCTSDTEAILYSYGITGYVSTPLTYVINPGHSITFSDGSSSWNVARDVSGTHLRKPGVSVAGTGCCTGTGAKRYYDYTTAPTSGVVNMTVEEYFD